MKFREYLEKLNKFAEENPNSLDMLVVTSSDDEGNEFNIVYSDPDIGFYEDKEFVYEREWGREDEEPNAVCVN